MASLSSASDTTVALAAILAVSLGFLFWRAALPKPLPGIPYNHNSAKRILGDLPDALKLKDAAGGFLAFMGSRCEELRSPIVQVFMKPMSRPFIVVRDSRECYDILNRRLKEFDQSDFFRAQLTAVWPNSSVTFPTNDHWRYNRKLTAEIMSPVFLREVAAPIIHSHTRLLVDLWGHKMRLARGRPFDVDADFPTVFNDMIWMTIFGKDVGAIKDQVQDLANINDVPLPDDEELPANIPPGKLPELFTAFKQIVDSGHISRESPLGRWHHEFAFRFYPNLSRAWRLKNRVVKETCEEAWQQMQHQPAALGRRVNSAVEFVIQREVRQARREGRAAVGPSKYLHGELAMLLGAGFETTSASMKWVVKYLTGFPDVQKKVRDSLRATFPDAVAQKRDPTPEELYSARLTYLDAFIEEVLRHSHLLPAATRTAITDTTILGHRIPKGTTVIMMLSAEHNPTLEASRKNQPTQIAEDARTPSSVEYKAASERWDADDLHSFNPERYLTRDPNTGVEELDPMAAPMLTFGGGLRACFGKRLAYLNMRIMVALIVWHYEFLGMSEELGTFKLKESNVVVPEMVYLRLRALH